VVFDRDNAANYWSWEGDTPVCGAVDDVAALRELDAALDEFTATVRGLIHERIAELTPKPKPVADQLAAAVAEGKAIAERIAALTAQADVKEVA